MEDIFEGDEKLNLRLVCDPPIKRSSNRTFFWFYAPHLSLIWVYRTPTAIGAPTTAPKQPEIPQGCCVLLCPPHNARMWPSHKNIRMKDGFSHLPQLSLWWAYQIPTAIGSPTRPYNDQIYPQGCCILLCLPLNASKAHVIGDKEKLCWFGYIAGCLGALIGSSWVAGGWD